MTIKNVYRPASSVKWSVNRQGIQLVNFETRNCAYLAYPEAAIWDLTCRGDSEDRLVTKISIIASISAADAQQLIVETIQHWVKIGFMALREDQS